MIFGAKLAHLVQEGRKTQTRRPVKEGDRHCRYRGGHDYSLQVPVTKAAREQGDRRRARTVHGVRLYILEEPYKQRLGDISYEDSRAEGFKNRDGFFGYWQELYDEIDFDLSVWVIRFELLPEPRLLARAQQKPSDERGYTHTPNQAMDELEAVDEKTQASFTEQAKLHAGQMREVNQARRERHDMVIRLSRARQEADRRGVDISSAERVIERQLTKIERLVFNGQAAA
jgi:hypothetical protein